MQDYWYNLLELNILNQFAGLCGYHLSGGSGRFGGDIYDGYLMSLIGMSHHLLRWIRLLISFMRFLAVLCYQKALHFAFKRVVKIDVDGFAIPRERKSDEVQVVWDCYDYNIICFVFVYFHASWY